MKIAIYQASPTASDIDNAFVKIDAILRSCAAAGATMVVFPELFLPGYNQPELHSKITLADNQHWMTQLKQLVSMHQCGLTIGWVEYENGQCFNSATCLSANGNTLAHYRKIQLFGPVEKSTFERGNRYTTFDLAGIHTALLICYDVEFAHHVQALSELGVTLILVPTANPILYNYVQDAIVPARAAEHAMTIAYANYCGREDNLEYGGGSVIVGPDAVPLAKAGKGETLLIAELDTVKDIDQNLLSTQIKDRIVIQS